MFVQNVVTICTAYLPPKQPRPTSLLLLHAMESKKTTRAELAEIRALLDQFDKSK
jgi:hypothetical protein